jgi:hypothetical protein
MVFLFKDNNVVIKFLDNVLFHIGIIIIFTLMIISINVLNFNVHSWIQKFGI